MRKAKVELCSVHVVPCGEPVHRLNLTISGCQLPVHDFQLLLTVKQKQKSRVR